MYLWIPEDKEQLVDPVAQYIARTYNEESIILIPNWLDQDTFNTFNHMLTMYRKTAPDDGFFEIPFSAEDSDTYVSAIDKFGLGIVETLHDLVKGKNAQIGLVNVEFTNGTLDALNRVHKIHPLEMANFAHAYFPAIDMFGHYRLMNPEDN